MTDRSCEEIRDLLVDYADGELSPQDSQAVAEHLAGCPECREIVKGLERSLNLATAIWLDNLTGSKVGGPVRSCEDARPAESVRQPPRRASVLARPTKSRGDRKHSPVLSGTEPVTNRTVVRRLRWVAVAAAILVAVGGTLFLSTLHKSSSSGIVTYAQIEEQATRVSAAAQLLAATQVLAKCQGTESMVEQQARYILSHYGDTPAASELKATMPSILKGATYD